MPPKKNSEPPKEKSECILRYSKKNNVVQWAEEMEIEIEAEYGSMSEFLTTNKSYVYPRVSEAELALYLSLTKKSQNTRTQRTKTRKTYLLLTWRYAC